jgi:hypothetical protein
MGEEERMKKRIHPYAHFVRRESRKSITQNRKCIRFVALVLLLSPTSVSQLHGVLQWCGFDYGRRRSMLLSVSKVGKDDQPTRVRENSHGELDSSTD